MWQCPIKPRYVRGHTFIQEQMKSAMKSICILGYLMVVAIANIEKANGAGECGSASPENVAWQLAPCVRAARDEHAAVSSNCCAQVKQIGQNPSCLCAVMLSNTVRRYGGNPAVAITIPKRCNFARPVGMKCGAYTLP